MDIIYKYELSPVSGTIGIVMPRVIKFLDIQIQNGLPVLWVLVDDNSDRNPVAIQTVFTGFAIIHSDERIYIGTYQYEGLVFHVFYLK